MNDLTNLLISVAAAAVFTWLAVRAGNNDAKETQRELKASVDKLQTSLTRIAAWLDANKDAGPVTFAFNDDGTIKGCNVSFSAPVVATVAVLGKVEATAAPDTTSPT